MRRIWLLLCVCAAVLSLPATNALAQGDKGAEGNEDGEILRRSNDVNPFDANPVSYPGGPAALAPLATGYYVTDNDPPNLPSNGLVNWTPSYTFNDTTGDDAAAWRRILSGPNQRPSTIWTAPGSEGHEYFRNPNFPADSTDNAIAGPISIGFPFYYYGRAYDSFYVSTNGLVMLSNRRYQYNEAGQRIDYNPVRDDPRATTANPATDPTPDDYGYQFGALNNSTAPLAGLMNPTNTALPNNTLKAVIAPLWDDTELSQYDTTTGLPDDFGRVYWRRDLTGTKLIIYYVNQSMIGLKNIPIINTTAVVQKRLLRANYQVVLDRADSSVQFNYVRFSGIYQDPVQRILQIPAAQMYRSNATIGIQSVNQEYTQYLYNFQFQGTVYVNGDPLTTPHNSLAIRFKQWKNVVRVLKVNFQVPNRSIPGEFVDLPNGVFPDNFEVLLGNPTLGVVRPIGIVQNVSDSIGPVNRTPQPLRFNVIFRIRDIVNLTASPVHQKTNLTKALQPIRVDVNRSRDTVIFEPYFTNAQLTKQLGRFKAEVIATDRGPGGEIYGDVWPFDDTTGVLFFGISIQQVPYITTFNDFDNTEDGLLPSVRRWVSIGAKVVDGDQSTYSPPPPRGPATSADGRFTLNSPVVKLDRTDVANGYYRNNALGALGGDTLISFPVNLNGVVSPIIIFSYQRAGRLTYPRGWSDQTRLGPEHAVYNTLKTAFLQTPDQLLIEFAEPSPNGVDNITNVTNWREATFRNPNDVIKFPGVTTTSPRWGVFGGGGGAGRDTMGRVVVDEFDSGKDFQFFRAYVPIPSRWTTPINANKTFRFRFRVEAKNDQDPLGPPADDEDAFYVDNVMITTLDKPEVEVTAVGADWPFSQAPASQARAIPLWAKVSNNGSVAATAFRVIMTIVNRQNPPAAGTYSYHRSQTVISLGAGLDRIEQFPTWNAQECGTAITVTSTNPNQIPPPVSTTYRISAQIMPQGYDSYSANDRTYEDFRLTLGSVFAYDDSTNLNDVPNEAGISGKGLNLVPPTQDHGGTSANYASYGPTGGSLSGSFAMQFRILTRDTIRGFQAYYGSANQSPDAILYSIYKQRPGSNASAPPDTVVPPTRIYARRGEGIPLRDLGREFHFDQYVTYLLPKEYVADPGIYYVTVSQLGQTGLELGADASRMGQVTTIRSDGPPLGIGNYSIPAYPEFRVQRFFYEVTAESGGWNPMITNVGNPGFPRLNYTGIVTSIPTYTRGSFIPMIRPYFGMKAAGACTVEPVELASFEVSSLPSALRLDWQTATEINNHGFHVERRVAGSDADWNTLGFKQGAGTVNRPQSYNYVDNDVVANVTYQYRLRQEDHDGTVTYSGIKEGRLSAVTGVVANKLEQNTPNPFNGETEIGFSVAQSGKVTVAIYDIFGKNVQSFDINATAGRNSVVWNGTDAEGVKVPTGVYVYKLIGNGFELARKMTVTR